MSRTYHVTLAQSGKVSLEEKGKHGNVILETIRAGSWLQARAKVHEAPYYDTQGHGWRLR